MISRITIFTALLFFVLLRPLSAFEMGSTVRVELRNGSVIIGTVVRTSAGSAWIKTRYGVFRISIQTVKKKTVLRKAPVKKTPVVKPPVKPDTKHLPSGKLAIRFAVLPSSGDVGGNLKAGFSASAACWPGRGIIRPGFSLSFSRYSGDTQQGTLMMFAAEAGCRLYLLKKTPELFLESRAGLVFARAELDTDKTVSSGLRPACAILAGTALRLGRSISISLSAGWRLVYERNAALHSFPVRLGLEFDF